LVARKIDRTGCPNAAKAAARFRRWFAPRAVAMPAASGDPKVRDRYRQYCPLIEHSSRCADREEGGKLQAA
jgi:hypothetical protein